MGTGNSTLNENGHSARHRTGGQAKGPGMRLHRLIGLLFALMVGAPVHAAGLKLLTVPADASGPEIIVSIWYPSPDEAAPVSFDDIPMMAARDGKFDGPGD